MTEPPAEPAPADLAPGPSSRLGTPPSAADAPGTPAAQAVPPLDEAAMAAARARVGERPELGRLGTLLIWAAGVQGSLPHPFTAPLTLVVAARHEAATHVGLGSYDQRRAALADRTAAGAVKVPRRLVDLSADGEHAVRRAAGDVRTTDALTADEALRAYEIGVREVDRAVDGGCDLLLVGDLAAESGPATAAIAAVLAHAQPQEVVGRRGLSTAAWMRTVEVVRDARRRARDLAAQPLPLLAAVGGADHACLVGVLVQAAQRRTPVLLSGPAAHVSGVVAETHAPGSSLWWTSASASGDPAEASALRALEMDPLLELDLGLDAAAGAELALAVLVGVLAREPLGPQDS